MILQSEMVHYTPTQLLKQYRNGASRNRPNPHVHNNFSKNVRVVMFNFLFTNNTLSRNHFTINHLEPLLLLNTSSRALLGLRALRHSINMSPRQDPRLQNTGLARQVNDTRYGPKVRRVGRNGRLVRRGSIPPTSRKGADFAGELSEDGRKNSKRDTLCDNTPHKNGGHADNHFEGSVECKDGNILGRG